MATWLEACSESAFYHLCLSCSILLLQILDLEILWKVLNTSMSSISYWSISMLWAFLVCELLLDHDLNLECLPLLGLWHLSVLLLHAVVLPLSLVWVLSVAARRSATWAKMVLKTTFMALFAKSWTVFKLMHSVTLTTCFAVLGTLATHSVWTAGLGTFLTIMLEHLDRIYSCAIPPFDLWQLKSFTVISCSLAYWSNAWYVMSSHRFFDHTHFLTSKCLVAWNKSSVLRTSFSSVEYWHLSMRFLILWSSWFGLTNCCLVWCWNRSHRYGSNMTLRLQGCPW